MNEAGVAAAEAIVKAWTVEGTHPVYHRREQARLATNWPKMYAAVTALVRASRADDAGTARS